MYQGMDDAGKYDFTESARLYLNAMHLTSKTSMAIGVLKGSMAKGCDKYKNDKLFGAGKLRPKGYWEAIQAQLRNDKMLTTKVLPAPYRPVTIMSEQGEKWLRGKSNERLMLKAIPEIYQFIPRKRKIAQITNNNNSLASTSFAAAAAAESHATEATVMNDKHLESILLSIRSALADFLPGARVVGIDTYYGNIVDDYDPEARTSSEEDDDNESGDDGNESDVIIIEQNVDDDDVICISSEDEDYEPTTKRAKTSVR